MTSLEQDLNHLEETFPCPHGRQPIGNEDGYKHCPHCLGINKTCLSLDCPERTGGACTVQERIYEKIGFPIDMQRKVKQEVAEEDALIQTFEERIIDSFDEFVIYPYDGDGGEQWACEPRTIRAFILKALAEQRQQIRSEAMGLPDSDSLTIARVLRLPTLKD